MKELSLFKIGVKTLHNTKITFKYIAAFSLTEAVTLATTLNDDDYETVNSIHYHSTVVMP